MTQKPTWYGDGIFSKLRARDKKRVFYVIYWHQGKRITERGSAWRRVPETPEQEAKETEAALERARELRAARRYAIDHGTFTNPGEKKRLAKAEDRAKAAQASALVELVFETAAARFLDRCGKEYADEAGVRGALGRMGKAFKGRSVDTITRRDIAQYQRDRLSNTGPFAGWGRTVGLRVPQHELTVLSALFSFLIGDEDREGLVNPCRSAGGRRRQTKATVYRPVRKPVIADRAGRLALFRATSTDPVMRALLKLTYYTAARPESEACRVLHGDVEIPDSGKVRSLNGSAVIGHVTYRDTKTGQDRCVPLHPKAVRSLQRIMLERPVDRKALEVWERAPVFRRADGAAWTRDSYGKRWKKAIAIAGTSHPELLAMILRDLRKTANTEMRSKGTDQATAARILGHSTEMNYRYVEATDAAAERAILAL